jgi:HK97 family phage major capsid protein
MRVARSYEENMTNFSEIKTVIDQTTQAFTAHTESSTRRLSELQERIEVLEARASNPKATISLDNGEREHKSRFEAWLRAPNDPKRNMDLREVENRLGIEGKAITIGTPSDGGYAVPKEIAREIERLELKFSPVRRLVKVVQTGTSDYHALASIGGTTSGWSSESGTRNLTSTPKLRDVVPTHGELYAYPEVSEWALDDMFFNVETWLAEEVAQEFAKQEGAAVISGDGINKPTGMLNTTPVLTADEASPLRAATAYQYIASDTDLGGSPAAPGIFPDALIEVVYTLNSAYRAGATWIMNSRTAGAVRKLKDAEGRYLWGDSLIAGQPPMLLGYPVETWEQMPDIAANAFPIGFGNWSRAYVLADRVGMRITRDNVTKPGAVRFYVRRREGGHVLNNDAAKFIRTIQ